MEIRTLLVADTLLVLALAIALQFYQAHQRTYSGFGYWVMGTWVMAAGYGALVLRGLVPDAASIPLANAAFALTSVVRFDGTVRFTENRRISRWVYLVPAVITGLCSIPSPIAESVSLRSFVTAVGAATFSSLIGVQFIRRAPAARPIPYRVIGALHVVFAVAVLIRATIWLWNPTVGILEASPFHSLFFLGVTFFEVVWGVAFTMMNGNRLEAELLESQRRLSEAVTDLQQALGEVQTLTGLLPICSWCKRVRDDAGYWKRLEEYLESHPGVEVSHGLCPDCAAEHFPDVFGPDRDTVAPGARPPG